MTPGAELVDAFIEFYEEFYEEEVIELSKDYPRENRSLYIHFDDLSSFDTDLADDYRNQPEQLQEYAEEALRLYDLPVEVSLGQAHVRIKSLPETTDVREIGSRHINTLVTVQGIIREATDVKSKMQVAAFECQRCATLTRIPQSTGTLQEPNECQGCELQGPFVLNHDQSEFVDGQTVWIREDYSNTSGRTAPKEIKVHIEDDIAGQPNVGSRVRATGIIRAEADNDGDDKPVFDHHIEGVSIVPDKGDRPFENPDPRLSVEDLDTYSELAYNALSTIPDSAREEETKAKLITPFIEALGWNKFDSDEVRLEYTDSKTTKRPDYALFGPGSDMPDVVVEAKQIGANLTEYEGQLYNYMRVFSAEWGVLTNGEEFHIHRRSAEDELPDILAEIGIEDLTEAGILDSINKNKFYE